MNSIYCKAVAAKKLPHILLLVLSMSLSVFLVLLTSQASAADKLKVVTTFTVIADMARNVAGETAIVQSITKPGAEIHNYQPTPRDIIKAQDADLILWNGMNLELWFEKFFKNLTDIPSVVVTEGIEPMGIYEGPYSGKPNPHAWMSPSDALIYVDNITKAFVENDPNSAEIYQQNAATYKQQIIDAVEPVRSILADIPEERRWLVSSEGAFSYLTRDFGLKEAFLWPINADQQGTPKQVRKIIDLIREENISTIFSESTIPADAAEQVARETGAKYGGVLYVDSLTDENGAVPTYIDLLKVTTTTIANGLKP